MKKLCVYVCEEYLTEIQKIIEEDFLQDVTIISIPKLCERSDKNSQTDLVTKSTGEAEDGGIIFHCKKCNISGYFNNYDKQIFDFIELPEKVHFLKNSTIGSVVRRSVYEWKLKKNAIQYAKEISEAQSQIAEYVSIIDLVMKIASYTSKRETIEKVKEVFFITLGAQQFKFWHIENENDFLTAEMKSLITKNNTAYSLSDDGTVLYLKIVYKGKLFGVIEVSDFIQPQYIEKQLNFATEIAKVCGLVLSNINQYENLIQSRRELQYLSYHDSLTGLYNRTYLNEIYNRNKDEKYLAVFAFDIDKLKYVNDNFGHAEGDKLICSVADILKDCFRETDIVARTGGDEFLSILPECDIEVAEMLKDRINRAIIKHNANVKEPHLVISLSVGFAQSSENADTIDNITKKADELMYVDKVGKRR